MLTIPVGATDMTSTPGGDATGARAAGDDLLERLAQLCTLALEVFGPPMVVCDETGRRALGEIGARLVELAALHCPDGARFGAVMRVDGAVAARTGSDMPVGSDAAASTQLDYASDLMMLAEVSRLLAEIRDPDEAAAMICTVVLGATGAVAMVLWRLGGEQLELAHLETAIDTDELGGTDAASPLYAGAARAVAAGEPKIERIQPGAEELTAWHEPLISGGTVIGTLSLVWPGIIDDPSRPAALITSLAQHSAAALDRADLLRQLAEAARTDALTGVANRRMWAERLEQELLRAQRTNQPLSLITIDIDHFKRYNDSNGHSEGDRLLVDATVAWSQRLRRTDLLARLGGEEFAVLLPDCAAEHVALVAESLRQAMPRGQTCSLGAATYDGRATAAALFEAADAALYRAKHGGRNRVELGSLEP